MNAITILAAVLVGFTASAYSLQCYNCDSSQNAICDVGLTSFLLPVEDCSQKSGGDVLGFINSVVPKQCVKFTAKDSQGKGYVARGCIPYTGGACHVVLKTLNFFSDVAGGASEVDCYTCDTDKCNSSFNIRPSMAAVIIISCLAAIFKL